MAEGKISISLPDLPKGKEFEEYISAFFQASGEYVERNIVDRGEEEVLELDIIVTSYDLVPPNLRLIEVKSGHWGFPDIFKVRGWLDYLNIENAFLIVKEDKDNIDFIKRKAETINVGIGVVPDLQETAKRLKGIIKEVSIDHNDIVTWRYSYWLERHFLKKLIQKKKSSSAKRYRVLSNYYDSTNSGIFFERTIVDKISALYEAFHENPYISSKTSNEMNGNDFDDDCTKIDEDLFDKTFYKCEFTDIAIACFIEHRARLAIMKSAVDYILYKKAGDFDKAPDSLRLKILGHEIEWSPVNTLPQSFRNGLKEIASHKYFHLYPIFWQWFIWLFGGFILLDYEKRDLELLSVKTGIPIGEIPNAFDAYNLLFPHSTGWFQDAGPKSRIRLLKMLPAQFRGIGSNYRRFNYTENKVWKELILTGRYTQRDIINWSNSIVYLLSKN